MSWDPFERRDWLEARLSGLKKIGKLGTKIAEAGRQAEMEYLRSTLALVDSECKRESLERWEMGW